MEHQSYKARNREKARVAIKQAQKKVSVVIPVYFREELVRASIKSLLKTSQNRTDYNLEFVVVDNGSNDSLQTYLSELVTIDDRFNILLLGRNFGKAQAVMMALQKYPVGDFFVNFDSDIVCQTDDWLRILVDCFQQIENCGMVSTNYVNNGNNPMPRQSHREPVNIEEDLVTKEYHYHYGDAVAGGCFVTSREVWNAAGGYARNVGVYGGVDGVFRHTIAGKLHKKCGYVHEVMSEHPNDRDTPYYRWKMDIQEKMRINGALADVAVLGNEKGFFDDGEGK